MADELKQATTAAAESRVVFVVFKLGIPAEALARAEAGQAAAAAPFHFVIGSDAKLYAGFPGLPPAGEPVRVAVAPAKGDDKRTLAAVEKEIAGLKGLLFAFFATTDAAEQGRLLEPLKAADRAPLDRFIGADAKPPSTGDTLQDEMSGEMPPQTITRDALPSSPPGDDPGPFTGSPEQLDALRLHVVNLRRGALSRDGLMQTTARDLTLLAQAIERKCTGDNAQTLMFYAHGGLTDERFALASAWAYHRWWTGHGVYPVFFVWETGALETMWQIVGAKLGRTRAATRDIFDHTSDPLVEAIASGPGTVLWSAMKDSARLAADRAKGGGAAALVEALVVALAGKDLKQVVAVGHSAGSIFHAHFLPALAAKGIAIDQLHLLAPAITRGLYDSNLAPVFAARDGKPVTMLTMTGRAERADNCGGVYRKSLLYLVSKAFERGADRKILGMEDFWDDDPAEAIDAVFGPTADADADPARATASRTHGGFDNDRATMESVLRRILGTAASQPVEPRFPAGGVRVGRDALSPPNFYGIPEDAFATPVAALPPAVVMAAVPGTAPAIRLGRQRLALCIGNDDFPGEMRLSGCVNDAKEWANTFAAAGFVSEVLADKSAAEMGATIRRYAQLCEPGDTLALHISSHGTQIPDRDGDEREDDQFADTLDEAVLGRDWDSGGLVIDDEWPGLLTTRRGGVHIVRFHDFCHAGRTTRMLLRPGRKVRGLRIGPVAEQRAVAALGKRAERSARGGYGQDAPYLTFCACQPHQLSAEEAGMGLFSRAANTLLRGSGAGLSATQLAGEIARSLAGESQQPLVEGPDAMAALPVFGAP